MNPNRFPKPLDLRYTPDMEDEFQLLDSFHYAYKDVLITCHKGLRTDLASIPRLFRWAFKGHGRNTYGAVPHDYLYARKGQFVDADGIRVNLSRKECDKVLLEACIDAGVNKTKAKLFYMAVRIGGWVLWSKK